MDSASGLHHALAPLPEGGWAAAELAEQGSEIASGGRAAADPAEEGSEIASSFIHALHALAGEEASASPLVGKIAPLFGCSCTGAPASGVSQNLFSALPLAQGGVVVVAPDDVPCGASMKRLDIPLGHQARGTLESGDRYKLGGMWGDARH